VLPALVEIQLIGRLGVTYRIQVGLDHGKASKQ
jgi:hypothetical protein